MRRLQQLRDYCSQLPGSTETFPFGAGTLVFKVGGLSVSARGQPEAPPAGVWKMYALAPVDADPVSMSLKCPPDLAEALREQYRAVTPGYHLNKRHWITVTLDGSVPDGLLQELVEGSYSLVRASLPAGVRDGLSVPVAGRTSEVPGSAS